MAEIVIRERNSFLVLFVSVVGKIASEGQGYLLYAMFLDVLIGRRDVAVTCLVTSNDYALGIGEVADA